MSHEMSAQPCIGDNPSNSFTSGERVVYSNNHRQVDSADKWIALSLIALFVLLFMLTPDAPTDWETESIVFLLGPPIPNNSKVILIWNPPSIPLNYRTLSAACNCLITFDKTYFSKARIVVFHWPTLRRLPAIKRTGQLWVWVNTEPSDMNNRQSILAKQKYFDCWATCRPDSDFIIAPNLQWNPPLIDPSLTLYQDEKRPSMSLFNKTRDVFWVNSCQSDRRFDYFVSILETFVQIDKYDNAQLQRYNSTDWAHFLVNVLPTYKYYLASNNNSLCNNHLSRFVLFNSSFKLIAISPSDLVVPRIVKSFYPHGSFIDANSFVSVQSFGRYLQQLGSNVTAFTEHTQWFEKSQQVNLKNYIKFLQGMCFSLKSIKRLKGKCNHGQDRLIDWFFDQSQCPKEPGVSTEAETVSEKEKNLESEDNVS